MDTYRKIDTIIPAPTGTPFGSAKEPGTIRVFGHIGYRNGSWWTQRGGCHKSGYGSAIAAEAALKADDFLDAAEWADT